MFQTRRATTGRLAKRIALVPMLVVALSPTAPALAAHAKPATNHASKPASHSHIEFFRKVG